MKKLFTTILVVSTLLVSAQEKSFLLEGKVVDALMQAIPDVYVVNLNSHEKDISKANGVFSLWVTPSDSIILSHISYYRRVVKVHNLLLNPMVMLEAEAVDIPEIRVSAEQSDLERAEKNMEFIQTYNPPVLNRMHLEGDPLRDVMTEHNRTLRSEASSLHIASFSPSAALHVLYSSFKRKDPLTDYSSTRKVVKPPKEEDESQ